MSSENVKIITTDYSPTSLVLAFAGQDAVLSLLGLSAIGDQQYALVEAAVKAGVKRFLPSEFGLDNASAQVLAVLPPFRVRTELVDTLKAKQAAGSPMEWTAVIAGMFLDWGFRIGFLGLDVEQRTAELVHGFVHIIVPTPLNGSLRKELSRKVGSILKVKHAKHLQAVSIIKDVKRP